MVPLLLLLETDVDASMSLEKASRVPIGAELSATSDIAVFCGEPCGRFGEIHRKAGNAALVGVPKIVLDCATSHNRARCWRVESVFFNDFRLDPAPQGLSICVAQRLLCLGACRPK
jgi:hypothetical protein